MAYSAAFARAHCRKSCRDARTDSAGTEVESATFFNALDESGTPIPVTTGLALALRTKAFTVNSQSITAVDHATPAPVVGGTYVRIALGGTYLFEVSGLAIGGRATDIAVALMRTSAAGTPGTEMTRFNIPLVGINFMGTFAMNVTAFVQGGEYVYITCLTSSPEGASASLESVTFTVLRVGN